MKHLFIALFFIYFLFPASGQNNVVKTAGVSYTAGAPTFSPGRTGSQVAIDTVTGYWYEYNGTSWSASGYRVQTISGCSAPAYTPAKYQSRLVINACSAGQGGPELYYYTGSAWLQINEGQTYTAGTGIDITGGVISATGGGGGTDSTFQKKDLSYEGKSITDTIQRTAPLLSPIWDKGGAAYNVAAYNIFPDGTDQTAKIQALLDTVYNKGGGVIQFGSGTYRINGLLKPKTNYTGANIPQTPDMVIKGVGAFQSGNGQKPTGGTILDMRYQGDTIGCLQFRGTGKVRISDITFLKGTTALTNTFIHSTLTTLHIHDCAFLGFSALSRNRAIVLGGNTAFLSAPDTSAEMGFQGYGTVIENNYFNWISAGVMLQTYANSIVIKNNNFWNQCGGFAAIWFAAKDDTNSGNVVRDNLIEMNEYDYGIYLNGRSVSNTISDNNFFDGPGGSINIKITATDRNVVKEGFNGSGITELNNTIHDKFAMNSGDTTFLNTNLMYKLGNFVAFRGGFGERIYNTLASPDYMQTSFSDISGVKNVIWRYTTAAASTNELIQIQDFNPLVRFTLRADATDEFGEFTSTGNARIKVKSGGELYIGDNSQTNHLFLSGTLYGGISSNTTPFKLGLSDRIYWGDTASPLSGVAAGLTSTTANVLRTINGSATDARHQALEFYATGTGANQLPAGTLAQRPATPAAGMTRFCTDCTANDASTGVVETYNGTTWKNAW